MNPDHQHDVLILGGTVIDGTRSPRRSADVGVRGGRISAVGHLSRHVAARTIDASGCIVAPGFIDAHTHDDQAVRQRPDMDCKISQGVTTVITGNCGVSAAPLPPRGPLPMPLDLIEVPEGERPASFAQYLDTLRSHPAAVNVAALVGHTSLRASVMSSLDRAASPHEIVRMRTLLDESLAAGAIGMSSGTFYPPARQAPMSELIEVGRPLTEHAAIYTDEGDEIEASLRETFDIGRALDVPVVISHHKIRGLHNAGRSRATLPLIRQHMRHQCVGLDCYPYDASSTMIHTDPAMLRGRVLIASSESHPAQAGRYLHDIASEWQVSPVQAAQRLQPGSAIYFLMDEHDVQRILAFDDTMVGSDGIPLGEHPHPRLWGTFARVLGHYCRDVGLFPLETAIWKMTGLTARTFGLADRGRLAEGMAADVVVFDPARVADRATYDAPQQAAAGIEWVLVNGEVTWQQGVHCATRAGRVLRRSV
jgi:N-acyl-D-amino-acid deacylase